MTNREIISEVRSLEKFLTSDSLINDRTLLQELRSSTSLLIKRETEKRKLWQSSELFTSIDCLEMIEVPIGECCEFKSDLKVARSKKKLPKIGEGAFGHLIQQISSIDGMNKFKESTPMRFSNILKLGLKTKNVFFWLYNNYLYVSNPKTKNVRVTAFFEEDVPNDILFPDCDCKPEIEEDACISDLDKQFKCPGYLIEAVKQLAHEKLTKIYFNVPTDANKTSNNNDESSK